MGRINSLEPTLFYSHNDKRLFFYDSLTWEDLWYLWPLPAELRVFAGNDALMNLVRNLIN